MIMRRSLSPPHTLALLLLLLALTSSSLGVQLASSPRSLSSPSVPKASSSSSSSEKVLKVRGTVRAPFFQGKAVRVAPGFTHVVNDVSLLGRTTVDRGYGEHVIVTRGLITKTLEGPVDVAGQIQVNGAVIYGDADSNVRRERDETDSSTAFLELGELASMSHHDEEAGEAMAYLHQWHVVDHEDFAHGAVDWVRSDGAPMEQHLARCKQSPDQFLTADVASLAAGATLQRRLTDLPEHQQLQLNARVHFIDAWRGAAAFAKIDGQIVWLDAHGARDEQHDDGLALDTCGNAYPNDRLSVPVSVIIPHDASDVVIEFGAKGLEPGSQTAALGIDDVQVSLH